jgi:hypothetical protein
MMSGYQGRILLESKLKTHKQLILQSFLFPDRFAFVSQILTYEWTVTSYAFQFSLPVEDH